MIFGGLLVLASTLLVTIYEGKSSNPLPLRRRGVRIGSSPGHLTV